MNNFETKSVSISTPTQKWEHFILTPPKEALHNGSAKINGSAVVRFTLVYKWRAAVTQAWEIDSPHFGKRMVDREGFARIARNMNISVDEFIAERKIDVTKPDREARAGYGQEFYVELVSGNTILDAYFLGDSDDLGYGDDDDMAFYGKKEVSLYIKDTNRINVNDLTINVYIGKPGSVYEGQVLYGEWVVENIALADFPPEFIIETMPPPRVFTANQNVTISPIDKNLIPAAAEAFKYIKAVAQADCILYGVQNYPYHKGGNKYKDAPLNTSDVFDLTGTDPAVFGLDSLSLIGHENAFRVPGIELVGDVSDPLNIPLFIKGSVQRCVHAWEKGAISTLSLHMGDPGMIYDDYKKDNKNRATGVDIYTPGNPYPWNFYGYNYGNSCRTAMDKDGRARSPHKPMLRLYKAITGKSTDAFDTGVLDVFHAYLDICADYCLQLQEKNIPVMFRPFHENSGDWFWWGNSGCENENGEYEPEIFKTNWRYIIGYMLDKGVHNCIYVYSPNGSDFDNEEKLGTHGFRPYAITYPDNDWVDICAFDDYTQDEAVMRKDVETVSNFATQNGKLTAASEVTGSPVNPAVTEFLFRSLTDTAHLPVNMAYLLQWTPPSFGPYLVSPTRANSGAGNAIIKALGNKRVIMANETNGFRTQNR
jgi:mannan endo-1,4-beta-mannosidase